MLTRKLGPFSVSVLGLGCMSLSHAYGVPPAPETAGRVLLRALDLGHTFFDTAALYGFGVNETLLGEVLSHRRDEFVLASKCGLSRGPDGKREIDGRPEVLKATCEESLRRLRTDVIDLYYLHRWDKRIPVEESVGALSDLVAEGKIRAIGLSEVSATTLRKAFSVHPIAALQTEYSLWTRNPEIAVLDACRELGVTFVAFSPLARGYLTGTLRDVSTLDAKDIRRAMPRFEPETYAANLRLLDGLAGIAREQGGTMGQVALAWVLSRGEHVVAIPGTTRLDHLEENAGAADLALATDAIARLDALFAPAAVHGPRYSAATQAEIDTEQFP
ncbi:aldo/keto reductase [Azospirillum sp. B506]|uniref:aldo/keto reductase n=1 Tax=Azospirillum sp. B506 TaxID=137721 RepID=UPI000349873E|nr:aldo/keto reductase [Azospirillum sp. B506]